MTKQLGTLPRRVRDIMVDPVTVSPDMHVFDGIKLLLRHNITGAPVVDGSGRFLGVLSEKCSLGVLALTARRIGDQLPPESMARARDFMARRLLVFGPDDDAFDAIAQLLKRRVSGAPVVDDEQRFLGVFSEKYSMEALLGAAYEQLPAMEVRAFMNTDRGRTIDQETDLLSVTQLFLATPYRRLPVVEDGRVIGQVSRRDVLRAKHHLTDALVDEVLLEHSGEIPRSEDRPRPEHGRLPTTQVYAFMDKNARTITEDLDLLSVAQVFRQTNHRRLPVLRDDQLVGLVSRRDLLAATNGVMASAQQPHQALLYLSATLDPGEVPFH